MSIVENTRLTVVNVYSTVYDMGWTTEEMAEMDAAFEAGSVNLEAMPVRSLGEFMSFYAAWKRRRDTNAVAREVFRGRRFRVYLRRAAVAR